MNLEFIKMAWGAIIANKLRSALTLLGMVIGVFSVIASVTAVSAIDSSFNTTIDFLGSSTFTLQKFPGVQFGPSDERVRNRKNLTYDQMLQLRRRSTLATSVSAVGSFPTIQIRYKDRKTNPNVQLQGSDEHWAVNNSYELGSGRFLTDGDVQYGRPVVVLGTEVVSKLFETETPIGKDILVGGHRMTVVGVLKQKGQSFGQSQDNLVVAPITTLFVQYGDPDQNIDILVRARNVEILAESIDESIGIFRAVRRLDAKEENDFEVITNDSVVETFTGFTAYLTIGGAGIGFIALLAAGIGIMNIMLVSVTERTREIGIRKSIGAKKGDILRQFLYEAIFLCQIGCVLGILMGVGTGNILSLMWETPLVVPWGWAFGSVAGVTIIALIFGVYPAWKAANLRPIDALRYE